MIKRIRASDRRIRASCGARPAGPACLAAAARGSTHPTTPSFDCCPSGALRPSSGVASACSIIFSNWIDEALLNADLLQISAEAAPAEFSARHTSDAAATVGWPGAINPTLSAAWFCRLSVVLSVATLLAASTAAVLLLSVVSQCPSCWPRIATVWSWVHPHLSLEREPHSRFDAHRLRRHRWTRSEHNACGVVMDSIEPNMEWRRCKRTQRHLDPSISTICVDRVSARGSRSG